jgi:hypothetical protein
MTVLNSGALGDEAQFAIHVRAVNETGFVRSIAQVPAPVRSTSMDDIKEAIISYQGGLLVVTLDGVQRLNLRTDFGKVLSRREVFVGFAAATDQNADLHDIIKWTMQQGPPTAAPSSRPSSRPSRMPSRKPSARPSAVPSKRPTTARERNFFERIIDIIRIIIAVFGRMGG